jgi:hypothetical protein
VAAFDRNRWPFSSESARLCQLLGIGATGQALDAALDELREGVFLKGERRPSTLLFAVPRSTEIDRHGAR